MKILFLAFFLVVTVSACSTLPIVDNKIESARDYSSSSSKITSVASNKVLDLSRKNLLKVDMSVFDNTYLEELNLSNNKLTGSLPSQIAKLKNLKSLNASNNQMSGVQAEIGQLSNLEVLDLSNNQLTGLPNELANLKKLKTLNLSGNQYSEQDFQIIRNSLPNVEYILK